MFTNSTKSKSETPQRQAPSAKRQADCPFHYLRKKAESHSIVRVAVERLVARLRL
jgi:hypothetical protein